MVALARCALSVVMLLITASISAQTPTQEKKSPTGSISGQVTVGGKGVPGIVVSIRLEEASTSNNVRTTNVTTDGEGRFQLGGLPTGRYYVIPHTPTFILSRGQRDEGPYRTITVTDGEATEGINFTMTPGGVITGRITTANGSPVIQRPVSLVLIDEQRQKRGIVDGSNFAFENVTDDRGIYRLFGIPAGRYLVCSGEFCHPGVKGESQAKIIEITPGSEIANIDIKLGRATQTYDVSGRIVTETGQLVPHGPSSQSGNGGYTFWPGDESKGEFHLRNLPPGKYNVKFESGGQSEFYSDLVSFEVTDKDINDIEIKVRRGASISGVVTLEGANDPAALIKPLQYYAVARYEQPEYPIRLTGIGFEGSKSPIGSDGRFRISGLPPGKVTLSAGSGDWESVWRRFWLLSIERNGVPQTDLHQPIEITADEEISGIRIILAYGAGVVYGQVKIVGGKLPPDAELSVSAECLSHPQQARLGWKERVEADGRFAFRGLVPGQYELTLTARLPSSPPAVPDQPPRKLERKQIVTVTNETESEVTFTLDLTEKDR